jgi:hypothetical protein
MLRQADDFKRAMLDAKHELELELSGARPLPSPPLRAAPAAAAPVEAAAAPAPAAPAPAPQAVTPPTATPARPDMSPDELTKTLASLADLRDRGAISAEEYEAKKAELLGRL